MGVKRMGGRVQLFVVYCIFNNKFCEKFGRSIPFYTPHSLNPSVFISGQPEDVIMDGII